MRIGVDLGGTKIEAALVDAQGRISKHERVATPHNDYLGTLEAIAALVRRLERNTPLEGRQLPVGLAAPGTVSALTGRMKNCNSVCLNGQSLVEDLSTLMQRRIRIANDADCLSLSEARAGAGTGFGSVFGVILGTGVGGGIVLNGQLLKGPNGIAGEWGHNPMPPVSGEAGYTKLNLACYCGRFDCIETYLSGPAFERAYQAYTGETLAASTIADRASQADKAALTHLENYTEALAAALATVINVLDPEVIVLGGGLSNIDRLYQWVPARWGKYVFSDECVTRLLKAEHGDSSGVRGAAWLWPEQPA